MNIYQKAKKMTNNLHIKFLNKNMKTKNWIVNNLKIKIDIEMIYF